MFQLLAGVLTAGPAAAHTATKLDANDTPGLLDLRSAGVGHNAGGVVHTVRTFAGWGPRALGRDSSFVIGLDKNDDRRYDRCAFIFFARGRLHGSLTNCGRQFLRLLAVSKPSRTSARISIPKSVVGGSYRWAAFSFYFEEKPCLNGCVDAIPNRFPLILHDLTPPTITMDTSPLRVWEQDTDATFTFPFSVVDVGGAGVGTWTVQRRPVGSDAWTNVSSGTGGGSKNPTIVGTEGTRSKYRVVAVDRQGNRRFGSERRVYIPRDDDTLGPEGVFSVAPTSTPDAEAWGGTYSQMDATVTEVTFTYTWTPGSDCRFELIGPGSGTWDVTVTADGSPTNITDAGFPDSPRQTLYSDASCASEYVVTVNSGVFGLDAVLG